MPDTAGNAAVVLFVRRGISVVAAGITLALVVARWPESAPTDPAPRGAAALPAVGDARVSELPPLPFTDQTDSAGVDFVHVNGAAGEKLLPEAMGGGGAFLDFDSDGDADILCVNGTRWPWSPDDTRRPSTSALFANDGHGQFADVTDGSGLDVPGLYGNGVACGDFDNDGNVDIYLTAVGPNRLFQNLGTGRFRDITQTSGTSGPTDAWSTSAGWFDYDLDGDLDLFVCNYLTWSADIDRAMDFTLTGSLRAYGRPTDFSGAHPLLFRNDGAGRFTDVSASAGIQLTQPGTNQPLSKALGLTFAYVDSDHRLDVLIANDTVPNQLFLNRGDGRFESAGTLSGIAFDNDGSTRGAMGIAAACLRPSDALGVVIGNYANEMTALYVNQLPGTDTPLFRDEAVSNGLGPVTRIALTFGVLFTDADLDGRLDIVACNGHLDEEIHRAQQSQQYAQPPQLLWNCGPGASPEFALADEESVGSDFLQPLVGRGATQADTDGDGDADLLLLALHDRPHLLRNDQSVGHHWLQVKLVGTRCNRDAIGARVLLLPDRGPLQQQTVMPTCSYQSQISLPLTFGLGNSSRVKYLQVIWPGGETQSVPVTKVDRRIEIRQPDRVPEVVKAAKSD